VAEKKKKKKYWTLAKWSGLVVGFNLNINVERQKKKKKCWTLDEWSGLVLVQF